MKTYLEIPCPKCQRKLRIPTEYLSKRLACKYCEHVFTPDAKAAAAAPLAPNQPAAASQQAAQLQSRRCKKPATI